MCGRYSQTADAKTLAARFHIEDPQVTLHSRFNIAPSQEAPVIANNSSKKIELMRWGLIPSWTRMSSSTTMINARAETITEKTTFKKCLEHRRCLVLADSFYEWARNSASKTKVPMRFVLKNREPFAFAGLWDRWQKPDGSELRSFTIITTTANELLRPIHDRMPVFSEAYGYANLVVAEKQSTEFFH